MTRSDMAVDADALAARCRVPMVRRTSTSDLTSKLRHERSIFRRLLMRIHPLRMRERAHRDPELPLQGLPAF